METELLPLGELGEIASGSTPRTGVSEFWNGEIPWVTPADLTNHEGVWFSGQPKRITKAGFAACSTRMLPRGSILFSSRAPIGHCAVAAYPLCTNQGFKSLVPNEHLDPVYGYFALRFVTPSIVAQGRGATFAEVSKEIMENIRIPVPPLPEQKRIAAILEKADRLRRTRRYTRQLSDSFIQSVFVERFGNDESCNRRAIQNLLDEGAIRKIEDGNHGEIHPRAADFVREGVPFLTATNVIDDQVMLERTPRISPAKAAQLRIGWIHPDDVLLSHNATVGRVAIAPKFKGNVVIGTSLTFYRLNQNEFTPEYFAQALRGRPFQAQLEKAMEQTTRNQVPVSRQKELFIPIPAFSLQQKFAAIVRRFERLRAQQREATRQAEHLFQTLLHNAFEEQF